MSSMFNASLDQVNRLLNNKGYYTDFFYNKRYGEILALSLGKNGKKHLYLYRDDEGDVGYIEVNDSNSGKYGSDLNHYTIKGFIEDKQYLLDLVKWLDEDEDESFAPDEWWNSLSIEEQIEIYKKFNK